MTSVCLQIKIKSPKMSTKISKMDIITFSFLNIFYKTMLCLKSAVNGFGDI